MSISDEQRQSWVDQVSNTWSGQLGLYAAETAGGVAQLLNKAERFSGLSRSEIAARIGISLERVNEVLDGDGNVHIATLARFMWAMDHRIAITFYEGK